MKGLATYLAKSCEVLPGQPSSLRIVVLVGMLCVIWVWLMVCIWQRSIVVIPGSVLTFVGALLGAKVAQTPFEDSSVATTATTMNNAAETTQTVIQ